MPCKSNESNGPSVCLYPCFLPRLGTVGSWGRGEWQAGRRNWGHLSWWSSECSWPFAWLTYFLCEASWVHSYGKCPLQLILTCYEKLHLNFDHPESVSLVNEFYNRPAIPVIRVTRAFGNFTTWVVYSSQTSFQKSREPKWFFSATKMTSHVQ